MSADIGRRFSRLCRQVIEDAQSVDHTELLLAANAYLAATPPSNVDEIRLSREMAHAAMELAVHMTAAHWAKLKRAVDLYCMHLRINQPTLG
jgi:hypothetical protein